MAERTPGQVSPGFWELPGGKIDAGESAEQAAIRELDEEIGIRALAVRPWIAYEHVFPLRRIRLHFFKVERWEGTPHGREGQRLAWIDPALTLGRTHSTVGRTRARGIGAATALRGLSQRRP